MKNATEPASVRLDPPAIQAEETAETPFYIAGIGTSTRPRRALKHGDCFAVVDSYADIGATPGGSDGLFFRDTRYLSHLELLLNGEQPVLLGSNVRDDNSILTVDLTNPDIHVDGKLVRRTSAAFGLVSVVLFVPDDLALARAAPAARRRFMDMAIAGLVPRYFGELATFQRVYGPDHARTRAVAAQESASGRNQ